MSCLDSGDHKAPPPATLPLNDPTNCLPNFVSDLRCIVLSNPKIYHENTVRITSHVNRDIFIILAKIPDGFLLELDTRKLESVQSVRFYFQFVITSENEFVRLFTNTFRKYKNFYKSTKLLTLISYTRGEQRS